MKTYIHKDAPQLSEADMKKISEFSDRIGNALKKATPMQIKINQYMYTKCECGHDFSVHHGDGYYSVPYKNRTNYCPDCGQALDWGE